MEDVLNNVDWSLVNLHCVNTSQYSDHNITLPRFTLPKPLRTLPFYVLVCILSFMTTLSWLLFYCSVTAIVAENSYFLWKQKPSHSSTPFELAIQKFNFSADLAKMKTGIEEASQLKTKDQKQALVKIALENRLCKFLIYQVIWCLSLIYLIQLYKIFKASFQNSMNAIHVSTYCHYDVLCLLFSTKR